MKMNWKNINKVQPDNNQVILVIDSWNICEDDIEGIEEDDGNMTPDFMSIRVAFYNHEKNMWRTCTGDGEQRVRFMWYMPITLPQELVDSSFQLSNVGDVFKKQ